MNGGTWSWARLGQVFGLDSDPSGALTGCVLGCFGQIVAGAIVSILAEMFLPASQVGDLAVYSILIGVPLVVATWGLRRARRTGMEGKATKATETAAGLLVIWPVFSLLLAVLGHMLSGI